MGHGYPPLTRSRPEPLGGAVEGSRCSACARSPQPGTLAVGQRRRAGLSERVEVAVERAPGLEQG